MLAHCTSVGGAPEAEPGPAARRRGAMRTRTRLPLTAALALLVAACSAGTGAPAPTASGDPLIASSPAGPEGLEGRTFLATDAVGRTLVPRTVVRVSFQEGQVGASGGCNSMGGPYTIAGGRLAVAQLAMTEMACEPALMDQDQWLAGLLDGSTIGLAGDTLTLAKDATRLSLLDREVADPDRPLVGTRWVVDGLVEGDAVSSVPAGAVAALTFSADRVEVETGCNRGGGAVTLTDRTITFGPVISTKMACQSSSVQVERVLIATLNGEVRYTITAGALILDAGAAGLTARATP
jgi:heat shock protein HslJ